MLTIGELELRGLDEKFNQAGKGRLFGAGINQNIVAASLEAIVSAANRVLEKRKA